MKLVSIDPTKSSQRSDDVTPEKRTAARLAAAQIPSITGIHLLPDDVEASLVNISTSGILVECTARPRPGTAIIVRFSGTFPISTVPGRVARALVAYLGQDGALRYHVGIAFDAPIVLDDSRVETEIEIADLPACGNAPLPGQLHKELRNRW